MAKMKVHELAKELELKSADIIKALNDNGVEVKAATSSIEEDSVEFIKNKFGKKTEAKAEVKEEKAEAKEEVKEEKKAKVYITSKGMVKTGERKSRSDGERRSRSDGEHRSHGDGERRKKRRSSSGEHHHSGEHRSKSSSSKKTVEAVKTEEVVVEELEVKVTPVVEEVKTETIAKPEVKEEKPEVKVEPKATETVEVKAEPKKEVKEEVKAQPKNEKPPVKNQNKPQRDGDRRDFKDKKPFNKDGKKFDKDKNDKFRDKNDKGFKGDRNFHGKDGQDKDRRDDRKDFRRDRNDRNDRNSVPSEPMQNKDRKTRENKLRYDKQERNKNNYEDGVGKGKKGQKGRDFSKPVLEKPKKKEEKKEEIKIIEIPEFITIGQLAEKMKMQPSAIIKKLFLEGKMVTVNNEVDFDTAEEIAMGFDIMCEKEVQIDVIEELLKEEAEDESLMSKRPPVVCVMGHVDHGKTSLLDAIRETNVTLGESGGITQHIGASVVKINDQTITFLDTPGHEAFTSMRMRGAQSTDIAILVVAADDGVMPQTVEAINHARAAGIEIIVAINKIDKPGANIDRVKQGLAEHELLSTDWGGNVEMVPVSAKSREGIDDLLEMVLLQADILELKANPNRQARGIVIEAKLDKGKGPVATVLVQKGTLKVGANIAAGANHGKVRAMTDDRGNQLKVAGPSTPVEILGLSGVPNAGEVFVSTATFNEAKEFANTFVEDSKAKLMESNKFRISLDDLNSQIEAGNLQELKLIIKADVQGSVEAVKQSLTKLSNDEVEVKVIHGGAGAINESDVILASASNAIIIGFNVKADAQAEETAKREEVDLRLYSVIYNAIDDIERAMKGMLAPIYEESVIGHAEIRQVFKASGVGNIAGSYVLDGKLQRGCSVRITRDGSQIFEGPLASLKRFKDDVKEVKAGYECGLVFEKFGEIAEGDIVEAYVMVEVPR